LKREATAVQGEEYPEEFAGKRMKKEGYPMFWRTWRNKRPRRWLIVGALLLLLIVGGAAVYFIRNQSANHPIATLGGTATPGTGCSQGRNSSGFVYFTLKQATGFVLARAPRGTSGQPLGVPQPIAPFGNGFGQLESDGVLSMQLSPDACYLAIDGNADHGEQVWIFDTQHLTLNLRPAGVMGNFLHWLAGATGHTFLYRPMFPLGPPISVGGNGWNPGLWLVDAATGMYKNIAISVPSALLVDASSSPDGSHIVYSTSAGQGMGSDTWMMNSDGHNQTHLFHTQTGAQSITGLFAWSPDGKSVAYELLSDSPTPFLPAGLWVMNSHGSQQRRLADTDGGHGFAPVWSPDSRSIAYVVRTNTNSRAANQDSQALQSAIAIVDVASGRSTMVATPAQTGLSINANPQWSADSSTLIFIAYNAFNRVLGGSPHYWSAHFGRARTHAILSPLSSGISHVVAAGQ
jgi:WD40-like Beta Propeller Repeat